MARPEGEVLWLDRRAAGAVDLIDRLGHLVEIVEVLDGGAAPPALHVGYEGRPVDGGRDDVVASEHDGARRIAGLQREGLRGLGDLLQDEAPVESHPVLFHLHPGLAEDVPSPLVEEVDPDLLQDIHRLVVDRLFLFLAQELIGLEAVLPHRR